MGEAGVSRQRRRLCAAPFSGLRCEEPGAAGGRAARSSWAQGWSSEENVGDGDRRNGDFPLVEKSLLELLTLRMT